MNNYKCDGCKFEEICEEDSTTVCCGCQGCIDINITDDRWLEMSYYRFQQGLLDWNYCEYSDGE